MRIFGLERKATVADDATLRHPMGFAKLEQGPLEENNAPELEACASQNAANEFRAHRYSLHAPAPEFVASPIVDPMGGQGQTSKMTRECIEKPARKTNGEL
jgi:hypothetical protein